MNRPKLLFRVRIFLMAFGLGYACFYMISGLTIAWEQVPVQVPQASTEVLHIFPASDRQLNFRGECDREKTEEEVKAQVVAERDLSMYEFGGVHDCPGNFDCPQRKYEASMRKVRGFIWEHWKEKKRGYIIVGRGSVDSGSYAHIFIEPDDTGRWTTSWSWERLYGFAGCSGDVDGPFKMVPVQRKKAEANDYEFSPGTYFLKFKDPEGRDVNL